MSTKEEIMNELKKEELLEALGFWYGMAGVKNGNLDKDWQAYQQITALIKKSDDDKEFICTNCLELHQIAQEREIELIEQERNERD